MSSNDSWCIICGVDTAEGAHYCAVCDAILNTCPKDAGDKMSDVKETNPKDAIGSSKVPLDIIPVAALIECALAFLYGGLEYGLSNYDAKGARLSVYTGAIDRHLKKLIAGQWLDSDSHRPHMAHIMANAAIIIATHTRGNLVDDRPPSYSDVDALFDKAQAEVAEMRERFKDRHPVNYTIADASPVTTRTATEWDDDD